MTQQAKEETRLHTRLLETTLEVDESRAYWAHSPGRPDAGAKEAFHEYWFGARSLRRIVVLLRNLRARYDAFPEALETLAQWRHMSPDTRRVICHWHLQLADPLYRAFAGQYLVERRSALRPEVTRDLVLDWVGSQGQERWTMTTRIQFASKLLTSAHSAGLVTSKRDPRPLAFPRVPAEALEYMLYLLRGVEFEGSLLENPYLASVGLDGWILEDRLRTLPSLEYKRQGNLVDFGWRHADLRSWARARLAQPEPEPVLSGAAR